MTESSTPLVPSEVLDDLMAQVESEGAELLGPDGLLSQVTKAVLERALDEELTDHLGYGKHDPSGRGSGNSRNGTTRKVVLTEGGAVDLDVPRDRNGEFEPVIVPKGTTRLKGFNDRIISLCAVGWNENPRPLSWHKTDRRPDARHPRHIITYRRVRRRWR